MALVLADDTVDKFESFTRFDLRDFMSDWSDFVLNDYPGIVNYFKGLSDRLDQQAISTFDNLKSRSEVLDSVMRNINVNFERIDFWNLIEFIDEVKSRIQVIDRISKFLRSAKYEGFNEDSISINYDVKNFETPESVAGIDRPDPQNDWADIYVKNHVFETDYQAEEGGYSLNLGRRNLRNISLITVVDNLVGDKVYGIDIDKEFIFENDDIKVLTPRDTARQSIIILGSLKKGDIPEFPTLGISQDVSVGSNLGLVSIPFIVREMRESFDSDDTLINFKVNNVSNEGSSLFIDYEVTTFYNFIVNDNVTL